MKNLIVLLLSFTTLTAVAQNGFKTEAGNLVWERSFTADNTDISGILDRDTNLKVNSFMDNIYKGMAFDIKNTCNGATGLMKNNVKFQFLIMVNPDGYVVKIRDLKFLEKYGPMQARTMANRCEKYFMDGTKVRTDEGTKSEMACVDSFLTALFSPAPVTNEPKAMTSN